MPAWIGDSTLVFVSETGERRRKRRVIAQMNLARDMSELTSEELAVTDFAVSPDGALLATIVSAEGPKGLESRLYLIPLQVGAARVEVPRAGPTDQMGAPSFRP